MSEMDILVYQILSETSKNKKATFGVDGQWAELVSQGVRDESNLEPGETKDVVKRFGIDLTIMRAYLPLAYNEINRIESVELSYEYDV